MPALVQGLYEYNIPKEIVKFWEDNFTIYYYRTSDASTIKEVVHSEECLGLPPSKDKILYLNEIYFLNEKQYSEKEMLKIIKIKVFI